MINFAHYIAHQYACHLEIHIYTTAKKLSVIALAENIGINIAAKQHALCYSMVSRWVKNKHKLMAVSKRTRKIGSRRKPTYLVEEHALYSTIVSQRNRGLVINLKSLQTQMLHLVNTNILFSCNQFKASYSWVYGFMKRHKLSLRSFSSTVSLPTKRHLLYHPYSQLSYVGVSISDTINEKVQSF